MKRLGLILLFAALSGCVAHRQWRIGVDSKAQLEDRFVIPNEPASNRLYSLAFVEFKNDGKPWADSQLTQALQAIDEADMRSDHHAVVITFIHGWKNNARQSNNNVHDFRVQLNRIAADACHDNKDHCGVVGIYLSWSGDVISRDWNTVRTLTYFDRRNTAAKVASMPIGDALTAIMARAKDGPGRSKNLSVVVGHSFGGLILEYAISKRMAELGRELRQELGKQTTTDGFRLAALDHFADLVVLINQAAPAARAVELLSQYREELQRVNLLRTPRMSRCESGNSSQDCKSLTRPLILSVSSESDLATRAVLPIAETIMPASPRVLPPDTQLPKGLDLKKVFTTAAAHTPQLQSHHVIECKDGDCTPCLKMDSFYIPISITLPGYAPGNETKNPKNLKYCVVRQFEAWNRTPYWIFQIPTAVVPDHGTIFTDRFTDFLTAFLPPLEQFRQERKAEPPPLQRLYVKPAAQP